MSSKYIQYIQESYKRLKNRKLYNIPVVMKDDFVNSLNFETVKHTIENSVPLDLVNGLDVIYVGNFKELQQKEVNALYLDGAIYVTNVQQSEEDLIDDLVHEIAHFVEEKYTSEIYGESTIEYEFFKKRQRIAHILEQEGYDLPENFLKKLEYDEQIDIFLYKEVGYPKLRSLSYNLFLSPYSITDIREYFAISFEKYFLESRKDVQNYTPAVYKILDNLTYGG